MGHCKSSHTQKKDQSTNRSIISKTDLLNSLKINGSFCINKFMCSPLDKYEIIKVLGEGSYGKVYLVRHKEMGMERAMKEIKKSSLKNNENEKDITNEIAILKSLDHPNIVKIFEFFITKSEYYLITEYCKHGELYEKIIKKAPLSEVCVASIMFQIICAVYYCHSNNIIHRDIKPENILISNYDSQGNYIIKIIDYGNAKIFEKNKSEKTVIGSCYYIAPEVLNKSYTEKCDIWSCGVIMYMLLSGKSPFYAKSEGEVVHKIIYSEPDFEDFVWKGINNEAKDLIIKMLEKNPKKRISGEECIKHEWFRKFKMKDINNTISQEKLKQFIKNLKNFKPKFKFQHAALALIVHNIPINDEIKELIKTFRLLDEDNDGKLTKEEVRNFLGTITFEKSDLSREVEEIFESVDSDRSGFIEYEEFVRACIDKEQILKESVLRFAFKFFDKDGSGQITIQELREVFCEGNDNKEVSEKVLKLIVDEIDTDGDGQISYEEFKAMMIKILLKI